MSRWREVLARVVWEVSVLPRRLASRALDAWLAFVDLTAATVAERLEYEVDHMAEPHAQVAPETNDDGIRMPSPPEDPRLSFVRIPPGRLVPPFVEVVQRFTSMHYPNSCSIEPWSLATFGAEVGQFILLRCPSDGHFGGCTWYLPSFAHVEPELQRGLADLMTDEERAKTAWSTS